jgi:ubiquitin carboxyl-terminal hydrolase L3
MDPGKRGELLEKTDIFASIHLDAASHGQTAAPGEDEDVDLHFTAFVSALDPDCGEGGEKMRLLELDGTRGGPIDRGECKNLLSVSTLLSTR